jgi:hypothetical protein
VDDRCRVVGLIPQYDAQITASTVYPDVIYLEGFGDLRCEGQRLRVEGRLLGGARVVLSRQTSCNRRYIIEGEGTLNSTQRTLYIDYYFQDLTTGLVDTCRATWVRY